ncbi:MAG: hypothetical protein K6T54_11335 [Ignavibacterium sp.]|nr:hypothetical protein [Ignavibacterium sp.]
MCGIFGVINIKKPIDVSRVLAARDFLTHRGPDDAGLYLSSTNASIQPNVALAHRRLSIIDLSPAAHQPMVTEDGRYTIVYNGEIYNFGELRQKIKDQRKKLNSKSDTEVILYLYSKYGKDCLHFLRGMFAFAIWDDKEKTLFAARDRFGIKPFYYLYDANPSDGEAGLSTGMVEFIFSSELKAIKHYKGNLTINNDALDAFLRTGSVPAPMTIYNEVASLIPGHYITINNSKCTIDKYWEFSDLFRKSAVGSWQLANEESKTMDSRMSADKAVKSENDGQDINRSEENVVLSEARNLRDGNISQSNNQSVPSPEGLALPEMMNDVTQSLRGTTRPSAKQERLGNLPYNEEAKKKIREALLDTIKAHLVSDVEVGAFLSGGIDSTAIVSLMRQCGKEKIKTLSIVFPDSRFDESKYSRLAAKKYNTEHVEIPFYEKDLLDDFENIMAVMDQPTIDGINTYFVSKAAKQAGLKVVLSGLGGDELFGGYPSFNLIPKYRRIKNLPFAKMFMKFAAPLLRNKLPAKAIHYMKNPNEPDAEYKLMRGLFTDDELQSMGWKSNSLQYLEISSQRSNVFAIPTSREKQSLSKLQYVSMMESCYYMRNQLLRDSDVFSMAHSIELRVPFVDHLLYEAVLPYLDSAYDKNFPKKMLVDAVGDIPDEIVHRPKMGFTFPFEDWIRNGQLKDLMTDSIKNLNSNFNLYPFFFNLDKTHWSRLWALFILNRYI